jgi:translation initiation factor IF-2
MAKIRVHELAKELGIPSKEMVDTLQKLGLDVKNHMSTMEDSQAVWVRKRLGDKTEAVPNKVQEKPASKPAPQSAQPSAQVPPQKGTGLTSRPDAEKGQKNINSQAPVKPKTESQTRTPGTNERDSSSEGLRPDNRGRSGDTTTNVSRPVSTGAQSNNSNTARPGIPPKTDQRIQPGFNKPRPLGAQENRPYAPRPMGTQDNRPNTSRPMGTQDNRPNTSRPTGTQDNRPNTSRPMGTQDNRPNTSRPMGTQSNRPNTSRPMGTQDNRPNTSRPMGAQNNRPNASRPTGTQDSRPNASRPASGVAPGKPTSSKPFTNDKKPNQGFNPSRPAGFDQGKPAKKTTAAKPQFTKDYSRPQKKGKHKKKKEELVLQTPELISVGDSIQVRELADKLAKGSAEIVKKLMELGIMATINQEIDFDTVEILASLYDVAVEHEITEEQQILEEIVDSAESLVPRSPIVTVMGHVDHGKTSLLDKIRKADVVSGEAGGITQHIGAYQVTVNGNRITFIDTPGHEAFTAMRARGANLTDIVVLVVAADDGVMPQTIEAINHIKAAKVPFLVALNKMDKPDVNPDKVMQQLTEYSIVAEEWGGDTMFIPVSAKTGMGIDDLLERVLLVAEMHDIKANPNRQAEGVVIEAQLDKGKGAVATLLVQKGTLKVGDCIVCGFTWCKVRAMTDYRGRRVDLAYPSMPVEITGWSDVPEVGEKIQVCDEKIAKEIASLRLSEKKLEDQKRSSKISLDDFFKQMQTGMKELNLIIKGDVQGSIEALAQSLLRLSTSEVKVNVIHSAVGAITETDVMLASASNAIIIGFNVRPDVKARKYGEDENIDVRMYRVIYEAIDDVKKAMTGLLDPEYREKYLGRAEVRATFKVPNYGTIAGSYIIDGKLLRNVEMRVLRDSVIIYEGKLTSLRRFKDDVKEVVEGYECGIGVKDFNDLREGDIIEAYVMEEIARVL